MANPKDSKYRHEIEAVLALAPGRAISFENLEHPWGLATLLYKHYKAEDVHIRIGKSWVLVKREPRLSVW